MNLKFLSTCDRSRFDDEIHFWTVTIKLTCLVDRN